MVTLIRASHPASGTEGWGTSDAQALDVLEEHLKGKGFTHVSLAEIERTVITDTPPENALEIEVIHNGHPHQHQGDR